MFRFISLLYSETHNRSCSVSQGLFALFSQAENAKQLAAAITVSKIVVFAGLFSKEHFPE